ncbi:MAG TPA: endo alpha-1,4 polygalactosaminidase, partial [Thermodesulfovibrionia bacterium]|nr:endo alpha-1,4 polygalactosaminidase [Thermodesulfovibrionia bacterium]
YHHFTFTDEVEPDSIVAMQILINFRGPVKKTQTWTWRIFDWQTGKYKKFGNNKAVTDAGEWTELVFNIKKRFYRYVEPGTREILLQVRSNNAKADMELDYEAVVVFSHDTTAPPAPILPGDWDTFAPETSWQLQLNGTIDTTFDVKMYDIDLFDTPESTIAFLKSQGRKVICYFSAGSYEDWRPDANQFPGYLIGKPLSGWPHEWWLDIRWFPVDGPLSRIMLARLDLAVAKGCDGVDPDNVNAYTNKSGFLLEYQDQLEYNIWLANEAHKRGLAVALKNDLNQVAELEPYFDFSVNEQCFQYEECELLLPFVDNNKAVFGVEYENKKEDFCEQANSMNFDFLIKDYDLNALPYFYCRDFK